MKDNESLTMWLQRPHSVNWKGDITWCNSKDKIPVKEVSFLCSKQKSLDYVVGNDLTGKAGGLRPRPRFSGTLIEITLLNYKKDNVHMFDGLTFFRTGFNEYDEHVKMSISDMFFLGVNRENKIRFCYKLRNFNTWQNLDEI